MTNALMPLLSFVLVIALIPAALWLMKRSGVGGAQAGGVLRPIANLSLGSSQRVAVVEIAVGAERHWLVLGVSNDRVTQLTSYPAPETSAIPGPAAVAAHTATVNQLVNRWRSTSGQNNAQGGQDGH